MSDHPTQADLDAAVLGLDAPIFLDAAVVALAKLWDLDDGGEGRLDSERPRWQPTREERAGVVLFLAAGLVNKLMHGVK